jgi:hypothetical protein
MLKVKRIQLGKPGLSAIAETRARAGRLEMPEMWLTQDLQVHHRKSRSRQGNDSLANLVTLSTCCHMEEHGQLTLFQGGQAQG